MSVHIRIRVLSPGYVSFRQMRALVSPFPPMGSMARKDGGAVLRPHSTDEGGEPQGSERAAKSLGVISELRQVRENLFPCPVPIAVLLKFFPVQESRLT